jgi:uncharacterized protein (TIRG00374 family)
VARPRLPRPLKRVAILLVGLLVVEYLVLPQVAGARKSLHLLASVSVVDLVAGVLFEAAAIAAYVKLTQAVLPVRKRPPFSTLLRIDLSTMAASHIVPGGSAAGTGLGYRLLTASEVSGTDAGFALATQGLGSAVVLNVLLWLALLVSIPRRGFNPLYGTAAVIGALLIATFAVVVVSLTRGEDRMAGVMCRVANRVPLLNGDGVSRVLHRVAERLRLLRADPRLLVRAALWASANWLLDAASLWVFVAAFGHRVDVDGLIVAFGLANVLAAVPVTPGGLGVVEAVLTSALVGFGTPRGSAVLGVVIYRLVNFWLPIPVGGLAYLSLRVGPASTREARAAALRQAAEDTIAEAAKPREWAKDRGIKLPGGREG